MDERKRVVAKLPLKTYKRLKALSTYFEKDAQDIINEGIWAVAETLYDTAAQNIMEDHGMDKTKISYEEWMLRKKEAMRNVQLGFLEAMLGGEHYEKDS